MTAHELAKKLLAGPDLVVATSYQDAEDTWIRVVDSITINVKEQEVFSSRFDSREEHPTDPWVQLAPGKLLILNTGYASHANIQEETSNI